MMTNAEKEQIATYLGNIYRCMQEIRENLEELEKDIDD